MGPLEPDMLVDLCHSVLIESIHYRHFLGTVSLLAVLMTCYFCPIVKNTEICEVQLSSFVVGVTEVSTGCSAGCGMSGCVPFAIHFPPYICWFLIAAFLR